MEKRGGKKDNLWTAVIYYITIIINRFVMLAAQTADRRAFACVIQAARTIICTPCHWTTFLRLILPRVANKINVPSMNFYSIIFRSKFTWPMCYLIIYNIFIYLLCIRFLLYVLSYKLCSLLATLKKVVLYEEMWKFIGELVYVVKWTITVYLQVVLIHLFVLISICR